MLCQVCRREPARERASSYGRMPTKCEPCAKLQTPEAQAVRREEQRRARKLEPIANGKCHECGKRVTGKLQFCEDCSLTRRRSWYYRWREDHPNEWRKYNTAYQRKRRARLKASQGA